MESLTRDSEISKTGRTWLAWGWGGVSIARVEKGPVRDSDRLSSLKHVDHLPRCPSTTACRLHPASCQRAGNAARAAHAACLNLPNDRHHIRRIPLGGRFVGRYRQRACSIKGGAFFLEAHSTTAPDFMAYPGVRYGSHLENFSPRLAHESHRGKPNYPSHAAARRDNVNTFIAARPTASSIQGARSLSNRSSHFEISNSKCSQRGLGGDIGGLRQTAARTAAGGGRASRLKTRGFSPFPRAMDRRGARFSLC